MFCLVNHALNCDGAIAHVGSLFDQVPKNKWKQHADDKCQHCQGLRFNKKLRNGKEILEPRSWYIDFNLDEQWRDLFTSEQFCQERGRNRSQAEGSYWQSAEAERLRAFTEEHQMAPSGSQQLHSDFSAFQIGIDWLEPWNSVAYSVGLALIRNCDAKEENLGKKGNVRTLLLIPGRKAPKNVRPYMIRSTNAANRLAMEGITVTERYPTPVTGTQQLPEAQRAAAAEDGQPPGQGAMGVGAHGQRPVGDAPTAGDEGAAAAGTDARGQQPGEADARQGATGGEGTEAGTQQEGHRGPQLPPRPVPKVAKQYVVREFLHRAFLIGILADSPAR